MSPLFGWKRPDPHRQRPAECRRLLLCSGVHQNKTEYTKVHQGDMLAVENTRFTPLLGPRRGGGIVVRALLSAVSDVVDEARLAVLRGAGESQALSRVNHG
eukprot:COSAG01_NODE_51722_length_352_cov_1.217391_1_plen_101_part_00